MRDENWNQRRAREIAQMRRDGLTWREIANRFGMSAPGVQYALARGCPPFWLNLPQATRRPRQTDAARPPWSYPDPITLELCRQIRLEMERDWRVT